MKLKRTCLFLPFVLMFVLFTNVIEVNAMNTGFSTEELTQEKRNTFLSNISVSPLTMEPVKRDILCFDVNENGMIAIGQKGDYGKEVCIYATDGKFLYGYTFNCSQSFGVEWDDECINIYFVRSDVIISLDSDGNILDIKKVQDTINNDRYSNNLLYSTSRSIGDTTYLIRNDMGIFNWFAMSYSQIVTIDATGAECIIYDVNSTQLSKTVVLFIAILAFVSVAVVLIIRQFIKAR